MTAASFMEIPLGKGVIALIDDADWPLVAHVKWRHAPTPHGTGYVVGYGSRVNGKTVVLSMHRLILAAQPGQWVDHANHNGLDNRRCNIRICTPAQNAQNRKNVRGAIPYRGVARAQAGVKGFTANITADGTVYRLGHFDNPQDAARAYDAACVILHAEFGHLNFPGEDLVLLGPVICDRGEPHPGMAPYVAPSATEIRRAKWLASSAQREASRLEAERLQLQIAASNSRVLGILTPRTAAIAQSYQRTKSLSETANEFGLSRERVRQVVARAMGAGFKRPLKAHSGFSRYSETFKREAAVLAAAEGVKPVAEKIGVSYTTLRAWMAALDGDCSRPAGRPSLSDAAARDARISAAVTHIREAA